MKKNDKIREKMDNTIKVFFITILFMLFGTILFACATSLLNNQNSENNYYAELLQVTNIDYSTNEITFKNSSGFVYNYTKYIDDIYVGDYYNALMMESGKENDVRDDIVVNIRYERPDLFVDNKNWIWYSIYKGGQ